MCGLSSHGLAGSSTLACGGLPLGPLEASDHRSEKASSTSSTVAQPNEAVQDLFSLAIWLDEVPVFHQICLILEFCGFTSGSCGFQRNPGFQACLRPEPHSNFCRESLERGLDLSRLGSRTHLPSQPRCFRSRCPARVYPFHCCLMQLLGTTSITRQSSRIRVGPGVGARQH